MQHQSAITFAADPGTVPIYGGQLVAVQPDNARRGFSEKGAKTVTMLGALQLATGVLSIVFQAAAIGIADMKPRFYATEYVACGIWCGIMFMITGLLGILAGRKNSKSLIVTYLVFNCAVTVIVWVLVGFAAANLDLLRTCPSQPVVKSRSAYVYNNGNNYYYSNNYYNSYNYYYYYNGQATTFRTSTTTSTTAPPYYYTEYERDYSFCNGGTYRAWQAMDILLLVLAIFEFAVAVASAAYCCGALPRCCSQSAPVFVVHQNGSSPAATYLYGPSMQPIFLQQGPSMQGSVLTNPEVVTGQMGYPTGVSSAQLHPPFGHVTIPPVTVGEAPTFSGYYYTTATSAPVYRPIINNFSDAPPGYADVSNN